MERVRGLFDPHQEEKHVMNLYPHQLTANRSVWRQYLDGAQSVLLQASTGAGKTVCAAHMAKMRKEHSRESILFVAHRREIIHQSAKTMREAAGLTTGIIMADEKRNPYAQVQVASLDTLRTRDFPEVQYVIFDEAHRIAGATHTKIYEHYKAKGAKILLLTATPIRTDGRGLKPYADVMVKMPSMRWLIANGYLVQPDYHVGIIPDMKGVKIIAGEFNQEQAQEVMMGRKLVGDVVENYLAHARHNRSILFASGVRHSLLLVEQLKSARIKAVHVDGNTPKEDRDLIKAQMEDGTIELISNAQVYIEGTDIPCIDTIVDAADTKSLQKYLQAGGRPMRKYPGKTRMLYLAHSGNFARHGRLELDRDWELTEGKEQLEKFEKERKASEKVQIPCQRCGFILKSAVCGQCGYQFVPQGKHKDFLPGMLVAMTEGQYEAIEVAKPKKPEPTAEDKERWFAELRGYAGELGDKKGWDDEKKEKYAVAKFKSKFDHWPVKKHGVMPEMPSDEVLKWIRHQNIAYAKGMDKAKTSKPWGAKFARPA